MSNWCIHKELGTFLLLGWSANRLVNGALKVTFCAYRPWIRDPRIIPYGNSMTTATGYSFPSGHTMNAATVYGGGALRKDLPKSARIGLGLLVVLVAFSRNFLGVHTPQDVIVGGIAGVLVMWGILKLTGWIEKNPGKDWIIMCAGIALAVAIAVYASMKSYPVDFDADGKLIVDGAKMARDTFKAIGWCAGVLTGWFLERRFVRFSTDVSFGKRLARGVIGLISYYAVSLVLVSLITNTLAAPAGLIIGCFIQMFYVVFLFPWCIKHFEKAEPSAE
ncbi:MAG: phosphatase PAP2 family protein [Erysipelotrichales bacterium]|nr:phosphatase PAP2 family protein [Erysipelotrichales bacterium]